MALFPCLIIMLTLVVSGFAQEVMKDYSFGYSATISPNSFGIPGWSMLGEGHVPQLLSDKVILTPPYGGNKKGALWTEKDNNAQDWSVEFDFRANGQERSAGNLVLWYTKNGAQQVSTSSIYTVGKFDGLGLLIDSTSGIGKIRGFLNDGSVDYRNHPNVDGLAFGHCDYNYRNLGRPSKLRLSSTSSGLEVQIDDKPCFSSDKVSLPHDYNFGLTASSLDPPDSFEAFKFLLRPASPSISSSQPTGMAKIPDWQQQILNSMPKPDDTPASQYTSSQAQFEDLHGRLHALSKAISTLFGEMQRHTASEEQHYQEILRRLTDDSRLRNLETMMTNLDRELKSGDHKGQFKKLSDQLTMTHNSVSEHLPNRLREYVQDHTPRIGFLIFSFIGFQCILVIAYVLYKRRRSQMPKKYL